MSDLPGAVAAFLDQDGDGLVLVAPGSPSVEPGRVEVVALPAPEVKGKYARVLVVVADRASLRAAVLPHAVRAPVVGVWVAAAAAALGLVPRPEWPPLKAFRAQPVGDGYLLVARFEQPVRAANVARELGRQSVWPAPVAIGGLVLDDGSGAATPIEERDVPPDVVLARPATPPAEHHVIGRAPAVVSDLIGADGPLTVGPLDERVLNPIGFDAEVDGPAVELASLSG